MSIILPPKRKQNRLQHHLQVFTHYCHLSLPQESSDLAASLKRLHVLEGGLGKIFFFIRAGKEALSPGAWITVLSCKPGFTAAGFYFKSQMKIIQFCHIDENFQVSL